MTKLERNFNPHSSTTDPGQARKRKLKRDGKGIPSLPEAGSSHRRNEHRALSRSGPSIRERLVAAKVKLPETPLPSLQEKLNSTLEAISRPAITNPSPRKATSSAHGVINRSPRRKAETWQGEGDFEATRHSETQRMGSNKGGTIPRKNRRVFDARTEAPPPVMVRGGMGGMAFGRVASSRMNKHKQPKRRIDVPLHVTGAELRLPSIPFVRLGWRVVSLLMVLMMFASLFLIWKAPVFQVNSVQAVGLQRLTAGDLNIVMGAVGRSVFTLNPAVLDENLHQAFPELSKISIKIGLPASVKVVATERKPVIAWVQDGNETWVDADGVSFPARGTPANTLVKVEGHGNPPSITPATLQIDAKSLVEGAAASPSITTPTLRLSPELVSAILALGAKMPEDTLLVYDSVHGLGWNDPKGWEVYFGSEDQDMEMKLTVYQALVEQLENEGIQPAMISVEFVHAPYYRMER